MKRARFLKIVPVLFALAWSGCGGGGGSTQSAAGTPSGGGGTTNPNGGVVTPTTVTVGSGQTTQGVDITVPVMTPALNAEVLGVVDLAATGGNAFNVGDVMNRGETKRVLMFGKGLSGSLTVTISGPPDITISNRQTITAKDGTPGIAFVAAVSGSAATGARTVILRDSKDNITTFTGGLEIR